MSVQDKNIHLKKAAIEALHKNRGNVSLACEAVGVSRSQFYKWKVEDADFKELADNMVEFMIDKVESKLHDRIDAEDTTAIIFYLKTIGKKRGYVERTENHLSGELELKQVTGIEVK